MPPEKALVALLNDTDETLALLSGRIYPYQAEYEATYPLVLYNRTESEYFDALAGLSYDNLTRVSIELNYHADSYSGCKSGAVIIRNALSAYSGLVETETERLTFNRIRHIDERDGFLDPDKGRTNGIYGVIQEYELWYLNE